MADNSVLPVNSGTETFANDDVGGIKYPRAKLVWGADGTVNDADTASGKAIPMQIRHSDGTILSDATGLLLSTTGAVAPQTSQQPFSPLGATGIYLPTDHAAIPVTQQPSTSGGLLIFRSLDLDETEEDVKTSAGQLYKLRISNFATTVRFLKLYNATAATVSVGSTTPIDTIPIPAAASANVPTVITESYGGQGLTFGTALSMAVTTGLADADTGAPAANDVVVSAYYK